jgi:hypothetical protein
MAVRKSIGEWRDGNTGVCHCAARARVPAFARYKVAHVGPGHVVFAACLLKGQFG